MVSILGNMVSVMHKHNNDSRVQDGNVENSLYYSLSGGLVVIAAAFTRQGFTEPKDWALKVTISMGSMDELTLLCASPSSAVRN